MKRVCLFGVFDPYYSRNRVLIKGFRNNNWKIIECRADKKDGRFKKYLNLFKKGWQLRKYNFDLIIVAFPGYLFVPIARIFFGRKIIFDAFTSLYNSEVEDRKVVSKFSLKAGILFLIDWVACLIAYKVLLDTNTHIEYFEKNFPFTKGKYIRVFVGTTEEDFYPIKMTKQGNETFLIHFHGSNIPLQGVDKIIEAAKILEDVPNIAFRIIGPFEGVSGFNMEIIPPSSLDFINESINEASVVLGIFGNTSKADMVIPNKVYEGVAVGKPVITKNTSAINELFTNKEDIFLCDGSARSLVDTINFLRNNEGIRYSLSMNGRKLFLSKITPDIIVKNLIEDLFSN